MDIWIDFFMANWPTISLEAFGYLGTALVLTSMMMTSVNKLRIVNMAGSVVSMTYAAFCNTWPVVFLNLGLCIINAIQLIRLHKHKTSFKVLETDVNDSNVKYFLEYYLDDIKVYFPDFDSSACENMKTFVVYEGTEAIGILVGKQNGDEIEIALDYVSTKYRDRSVAKFLFGHLKDYGIKSLSAMPTGVKKHNEYLSAMDFRAEGERMVKIL